MGSFCHQQFITHLICAWTRCLRISRRDTDDINLVIETCRVGVTIATTTARGPNATTGATAAFTTFMTTAVAAIVVMEVAVAVVVD